MRYAAVLLLMGLCCFIPPQACVAGETGKALKADDIKAEPFRDARTVGRLAAGASVGIVKREGGWYMISSPRKGWVRMLSIKLGGAASAPGVKASGVTALATGRAGTGNVVSTTGVRGLGEEDLKKAQFDEGELKLADSYGVSKADAAQFAGKAKLTARSVAYLP